MVQKIASEDADGTLHSSPISAQRDEICVPLNELNLDVREIGAIHFLQNEYECDSVGLV